MNSSQTCLLCSHPALRHIRAGAIYWLCRYCRQEVPVLESSSSLQLLQKSSVPVSCRDHLFSPLEHC